MDVVKMRPGFVRFRVLGSGIGVYVFMLLVRV